MICTYSSLCSGKGIPGPYENTATCWPNRFASSQNAEMSVRVYPSSSSRSIGQVARRSLRTASSSVCSASRRGRNLAQGSMEYHGDRLWCPPVTIILYLLVEWLSRLDLDLWRWDTSNIFTGLRVLFRVCLRANLRGGTETPIETILAGNEDRDVYHWIEVISYLEQFFWCKNRGCGRKSAGMSGQSRCV